ncbi:ABC transporter permease [Streptomyces sp. NBC_01803]|uniref:ABC transporter permease n=1 Tax=Streptomyces sp. NBC_01803 TaxID=2975946 RepID=UPI002DDB5247|nr:ABC transporter permease [Streptomyces sp. NBC_01803]WSA43313.1 ABC transporter permease [Streptomyces sp. NBC_01803]
MADHTTGGSARDRRAVRRLLTAYSLAVYLFLFFPLVITAVYAFNAGEIVPLWEGWSVRWFRAAAGNDGIREAIALSLAIGLGSAAISVVLGTAAALGLAGRGRRSGPLQAFLILGLVVPELMLAIGLLLYFDQANTPLGRGPMMVSHSLFGIALVMMTVRARLSRLPMGLELASADLGATRWATFRQVTLPQLYPAILAGGLLAFTFSFDDVILSQFLAGSGNTTWPLYILASLRTGLSPEVNAAATLVFGGTVLLLAGCGGLLRLAAARGKRAADANPLS